MTTILQQMMREIQGNELSRALVELWQTNLEANHSEEKEEYQKQDVHQATNSLLDEKTFLYVLVANKGEAKHIFPSQKT